MSDRADRISSAGTTPYTVNNNGNVTTKGADSFGYDQANRLKTATVGGASSSYIYNGDGNRTSKSVGGVTTQYLYDVNRSLPVLLDDGTRKYVWGPGLAYAVDSSDNPIVYQTDGLGSVRALTDATGAVVATYETDEYGMSTLTGGTITQPFGYTGEVRDPETGLVYLRARYYDSTTGRFMSKDPFGGIGTSPSTLNSYSYALNNPVGHTDPSGELIDTVADLAFIGYDIYRLAADNVFGEEDNLQENLAALGADAAGVLIPGATGLGVATRLAKGASTAKVLRGAARRASTSVGMGRGAVHGTQVHTAFRKEVGALKRMDLDMEVSYRLGVPVNYGTPGSIRVDVIRGPRSNPKAIYDLKTGSAELTPDRIADFRKHLPVGARDIPILEVRP